MQIPGSHSPITLREKNRQAALPIAIVLFSAIVRLWELGAQSLWFDETYTVFVAQKPLSLMLRYLIADGVHPPLYYFLMAIWVRFFGTSAWVLRLPSVLSGVLSVALMFLLVKRMAGRDEAAVAAILLAISPFCIWYSQDARMYALDCLAGIAAVFFFWEYLQKPSRGNFLGLLLTHAVFFEIHYFGVFLVLSEACFLILFRRKYSGRWLGFILAQIAAGLPLAVWIGVLLHRANGSFGIGWIPKPNAIDPILTILNFFFSNAGGWAIPAMLGGLILICLFFLAMSRKESRETFWLGFLWLVVPILIVWILSRNVPVYIDRYLIFTLPAAIILISVGAKKIAGIAAYILPGCLMVLMSISVWNMLVAANGFQKEGWREAAQFIDAQYRPADRIILRVFQETVPFTYYGGLSLPWDALEINGQIQLPQKPAASGRCILVYWVPAQSAHSFGAEIPVDYVETNDLIKGWIAKNCALEETQQAFHGILVLIMAPAHNCV